MNREAIKKTVIERFDGKDQVWVVQSPLLPICHGIDEDIEAARKIFDDLLNAMYIQYLEGNAVGDYRRGRPSKGLVDIHVQVKPQVREALKRLAAEKEISQGETVHYLLACWEYALQPRKKSARGSAKKKAG
jgi:DNA polymerase/3'-5' exonuclease PolX